MQRTFAGIIAIVSLFAVVAQFLLMMNNRTATVGETAIRFFSFFTILTNTLVAAYFSYELFRPKHAPKTSALTALTVYILVVGLVYQVVLRPLWEPTGWQRVVDELLHSINPLLVLLFWARYGRNRILPYRQAIIWLLYPALYLVFVLIRESYSSFYPYPFLDVNKIGHSIALINCAFVTALFILLSCLFIYLGSKQARKITTTRTEASSQ